MLPTIKSDSIYPLPNDVAIYNIFNRNYMPNNKKKIYF